MYISVHESTVLVCILEFVVDKEELFTKSIGGNFCLLYEASASLGVL